MNKYLVQWKTKEPNAKERRLFLTLQDRDNLQREIAKKVNIDFNAIEIVYSRQINQDTIPTPAKTEIETPVSDKAKSYLESKII